MKQLRELLKEQKKERLLLVVSQSDKLGEYLKEHEGKEPDKVKRMELELEVAKAQNDLLRRCALEDREEVECEVR